MISWKTIIISGFLIAIVFSAVGYYGGGKNEMIEFFVKSFASYFAVVLVLFLIKEIPQKIINIIRRRK